MQFTEIVWNKRDEILFCVSIFIKDMELYLGIILRIHNEECHIYINI